MTQWTKRKIIRKLQELEKYLGRTPVLADDTTLACISRNYFGSWNNAKKAAGIKTFAPVGYSGPNILKNRKYARILTALKKEPMLIQELEEKLGYSKQKTIYRLNFLWMKKAVNRMILKLWYKHSRSNRKWQVSRYLYYLPEHEDKLEKRIREIKKAGLKCGK